MREANQIGVAPSSDLTGGAGLDKVSQHSQVPLRGTVTGGCTQAALRKRLVGMEMCGMVAGGSSTLKVQGNPKFNITRPLRAL